MYATAIALFAATMGVNYSWKPAVDGGPGYDVLVTLDRQEVDPLDNAEEIGKAQNLQRHLPDFVRPIRNVRIEFGENLPHSDSDGSVEQTAFRQYSQGWTTRPQSSPPRSDNYPATISRSGVQPNTVVGAVQGAGNAVMDSTRSGLRDMGQRIEETGQTVGAVAGDFLDDGREQFQAAGQAVRDATGRLVDPASYGQSAQGLPAAAPTGALQRNPYRNIPTQQSPADSGVRVVADPGENPWDGRSPTLRGPLLSDDYRNQTPPSQNEVDSRSENSLGADSQAPPNSSFAQERSNAGMVPVPGIDRDVRNANGWPDKTGNDYRTGGVYAGVPASGGADPNRQTGQYGVGAGNPAQNAYQQSPFAELDRRGVPLATNAGNRTDAGAGLQTNPGNYANDPRQQVGQFQQAPTVGSDNAIAFQGQQQASGSNVAQEPKWVPLIVTGLALMGSLGANLFLGVSYLDARHKYLSAIRRGSRSFSRGEESLR